MRRRFGWLVLVGGVVVLGVLWQAFAIAAYVRGAGDGALDAHLFGSFVVHVAQLAIVIEALVAYWGNWGAVGTAIGFLVVCIAQLGLLGNTDEQGGWINGLHGFLAPVILIAASCTRNARHESSESGSRPALPVVPDGLHEEP